MYPQKAVIIVSVYSAIKKQTGIPRKNRVGALITRDFAKVKDD
jgi:hypothetical protein